MKNNDFMAWIGSVFGTILTATQQDEVLRWIQLGLTILSTLIAIAYTIWKWWRKASADGKITPDEVDELVDDLKEIDKKGDQKDD